MQILDDNYIIRILHDDSGNSPGFTKITPNDGKMML